MSTLLAVDEQLARGRRVDQRDDAGERGLAAAAFADDGQRLALLDREADALDRMDRARLAEQAAGDVVVARRCCLAFEDRASCAAPSRLVGHRNRRWSAGGRRWRCRAAPTAARGCSCSSALSNSDSTSASSILRPLYWTIDAVGGLGDHAHIVGDHDQAHAVLGLQAASAGRGSASGW